MGGDIESVRRTSSKKKKIDACGRSFCETDGTSPWGGYVPKWELEKGECVLRGKDEILQGRGGR